MADLAGFIRILREDFPYVYSPVAALNLTQVADSLLAEVDTKRMSRKHAKPRDIDKGDYWRRRVRMALARGYFLNGKWLSEAHRDAYLHSCSHRPEGDGGMTPDQIFDIRDRNSQRLNHHDSQPHGTMYSSADFMRTIFDCDALLRHTLRLERFLTDEGYRRCDAPACNCGSWHKIEKPQIEKPHECSYYIGAHRCVKCGALRQGVA